MKALGLEPRTNGLKDIRTSSAKPNYFRMISAAACFVWRGLWRFLMAIIRNPNSQSSKVVRMGWGPMMKKLPASVRYSRRPAGGFGGRARARDGQTVALTRTRIPPYG